MLVNTHVQTQGKQVDYMRLCFVSDVYIHGGYNGLEAFADLWRLNLTTFEWQKLPCKSPVPLYFHSAAVTEVRNSFHIKDTQWLVNLSS